MTSPTNRCPFKPFSGKNIHTLDSARAQAVVFCADDPSTWSAQDITRILKERQKNEARLLTVSELIRRRLEEQRLHLEAQDRMIDQLRDQLVLGPNEEGQSTTQPNDRPKTWRRTVCWLAGMVVGALVAIGLECSKKNLGPLAAKIAALVKSIFAPIPLPARVLLTVVSIGLAGYYLSKRERTTHTPERL